MLFALGFLSLMIGCALLIFGETPLSKTRRIPAKPSRIAGAIQVAFFPLVLGLRYLWIRFNLEATVPSNVAFAILWVLLAMTSGWIALRAAFAKKKGQSAALSFPGVSPRDPFAMEEPIGAPTAPTEEVPLPSSNTVQDVPFSFEPVAAPPKAKKAPTAPPSKPANKKSASQNPFDFS